MKNTTVVTREGIPYAALPLDARLVRREGPLLFLKSECGALLTAPYAEAAAAIAENGCALLKDEGSYFYSFREGLE